MTELPKGWNTNNLDDVCEVRKGSTITKNGITEGDVPVIAGGQVPAYYHNQHNRSGKTITVSGSGAYAGFVNFFEIPIFASDCTTIQPINQDEVDAKYIYLFLKSNQNKIYSMQKGIAQPHVYPKDLAKMSIIVPPPPTQRRIVAILESAEKIKNHHAEQSRLLDDYLKSVFLEMFGDPEMNLKGLETGSLTDFGSFKNGLNFNNGESGIKVRYLGVGNFGTLSIIDHPETLSHIELNVLPSDDFFLRDGDVVFVRSNGNRELVGRSVVIYPGKEKITYSGFCIRYRVEATELNVTFLNHLFRVPSFRKMLLQGGRGANIQNINQKILSSLEIPIPPIDLQNKFAAIVQQTERIKAQHEESARKSEELFNSLMQKAFIGELVA